MMLFLVLIILEVVSVLLCMVTIKRLYSYINKYRFDESVYTLLFGFIRIRYFVSLYVFMTALTAVSGLLFTFSLMRF